jgi:hypothetical protein
MKEQFEMIGESGAAKERVTRYHHPNDGREARILAEANRETRQRINDRARKVSLLAKATMVHVWSQQYPKGHADRPAAKPDWVKAFEETAVPAHQAGRLIHSLEEMLGLEITE